SYEYVPANPTEKQIAEGKEVTDYLSVEEITRFQQLEAVRMELVKKRDSKKSRRKNVKGKLDAYCAGRKKYMRSVHNQLEWHGKQKKLSKGKAFGGSFDGTDAKMVMKDPWKIFDGFRSILKGGCRDGLNVHFIDTLCDDIISLLELRNNFFSLLQKEKPTEEDKLKAQDVAEAAVTKHREVVKNVTPKVHIAHSTRPRR
ncbi:hypothetical protein ACHAXR_000674, partial [Thalassiosira sp. AJA248-18]